MSIPKAVPSAQLDIENVVVISEIDRQKFQDSLNEHITLGYMLTHFSTAAVDVFHEDIDSYQDVEFTAILQLRPERNLP